MPPYNRNTDTLKGKCMNSNTKPMLVAMATACLLAACASKPKAPPPPPPAPPMAMNMTMSGDALFAFGKADIGDLSSEGRGQLDEFAAKLSASPYGLVRVVGHSDRVGNDKANMSLSKRRAEAVRDYLAQHGVPDAKIVATGRGSYQPVVKCDQERGQAMIDCLAPNRRVEITVDPMRP